MKLAPGRGTMNESAVWRYTLTAGLVNVGVFHKDAPGVTSKRQIIRSYPIHLFQLYVHSGSGQKLRNISLFQSKGMKSKSSSCNQRD
jgi:hypothetical protein